MGRLWELLRIAGPVTLSFALDFSLQLVSIFIIGHYEGGKYLPAIALASTFVNVTGKVLVVGLASVIDTLCSQSYGAKAFRVTGVAFQTGLVLMVGVLPFVYGVWALGRPIMVLARQDPELASMAARYALLYAPGFVFYGLMEGVRRYLSAMRVVNPLVVLAALGSAVHAAMCWLLVHTLGMGFDGAPLAMGGSHFVQFLFTVLYVVAWRPAEVTQTWPGIQVREAVAGVRPAFGLALPGLLQTGAEWWAWEIGAWRAGAIGKNELDMFLIGVSLLGASYMITLGLAVASSTLVGNNLGAGRPDEARRVMRYAFSALVFGQVASAAALLLAPHALAAAFSSDPVVQDSAAGLMPYLAGAMVFDSTNGVIQGVLRGAGLQRASALINLCSFYLVGLPLVFLLTFQTSLDVAGIWIGLGAGAAAAVLLGTVLLVRLDWNEVAAEAAARTKEVEMAGLPSPGGGGLSASSSAVGDDLSSPSSSRRLNEDPGGDGSLGAAVRGHGGGDQSPPLFNRRGAKYTALPEADDLEFEGDEEVPFEDVHGQLQV